MRPWDSVTGTRWTQEAHLIVHGHDLAFDAGDLLFGHLAHFGFVRRWLQKEPLKKS